MNRKQFVILLVLVLVLGGAGWKYWSGKSADWSSGGTAIGQKLLGEFDVNAVAQIAIKQGDNELVLARKDDRWRVAQRGDYPANFSEISSLLLKLKDLKVVQTEAVGPSQLPRLELAAGEANPPTVVELRDAGGKAIKSLTLGKKHFQKRQGAPAGDFDDPGWPDGRYVIAGTTAGSVSLISDPLANVEPKPENWLDKDFFKVEKARTIAVTFREATNSWKLERESEGGELKLVAPQAGEELDAGKISGLSQPFSSPNFVDVIVGTNAADLGLEQPTQVTVETFDDFTYSLKVGTKTNDNYPVTVAVTGKFAMERTPGTEESAEDKTRLDQEFADKLKVREEKLAREKAFESWTYLVSGWSVDSVVKERGQLLAEKKAEDAAANDDHDHAADGAEILPPGIPGLTPVGTP